MNTDDIAFLEQRIANLERLVLSIMALLTQHIPAAARDIDKAGISWNAEMDTLVRAYAEPLDPQ